MGTPTKGPVTIDRDDGEDGGIYYAVHGHKYEFITNFDKKADAELTAEAFNVLHETGLSPRALSARNDELVAALRDLDACYCEASDDMSRAQRDHHRKVLTKAREIYRPHPLSDEQLASNGMGLR